MAELRVDAVAAPPPVGSFLGGAVSAAGTLITIPAGRIWRGKVTISASTSATGSVSIVTGGTGVTPPATQPIIEARLSSTNQSISGGSAEPMFFVYAGSTDATLAVATTGTVVVNATAYGWLV